MEDSCNETGSNGTTLMNNLISSTVVHRTRVVNLASFNPAESDVRFAHVCFIFVYICSIYKNM